MNKPLPHPPALHTFRYYGSVPTKTARPQPATHPNRGLSKWTAFLLSPNVTWLTYTILLTSFLLLLLAILQIVCEAHLLHAFKHTNVQLPGSSLAEWLFIPMHPSTLDNGPMVGIFVVGGWSLLTSTFTVLWVGCLWCGARREVCMNPHIILGVFNVVAENPAPRPPLPPPHPLAHSPHPSDPSLHLHHGILPKLAHVRHRLGHCILH